MRIKITVNHPKRVTVHGTELDVGHVEEICWGWEFEDNSLSFDGFITDRDGKRERYIDKILTIGFLTRILDAYYNVGKDDDHVVYSDSDGLKEVTIPYDSDVLYDIFLTKIDVAQIINYLRDNYNFFYDPNRKELEKAVKEAEIEQHCGKNREDFWRERALKAEEELKRKSNKIAGIEEGLQWKDKIIERQKQSIKEMVKEIDHLRFKLEGDEYPEFIHNQILQVYREIFDCSNGDPEGTDMENLTDILTEYKRVLALKDAAEEKTIRYKEELRSVNESFEYQTSELCKILGLDAGSPPEDILEAVEDLSNRSRALEKIEDILDKEDI